MTYKNESEVEDHFVYLLRKNGWNTQQQVQCDETKHWSHPWTVDIITHNPYYPEIGAIGIELKFIRGVRKGKPLVEAYEQLCKYEKKTFSGERPNIWCLGFYFDCCDAEWSRDAQFNTKEICRSMFNYWGFGLIDLNELEKAKYKMELDFGHSNEKFRMDIYNKYGINKLDPEKLIDRCKKKRERFYKTIAGEYKW